MKRIFLYKEIESIDNNYKILDTNSFFLNFLINIIVLPLIFIFAMVSLISLLFFTIICDIYNIYCKLNEKSIKRKLIENYINAYKNKLSNKPKYYLRHYRTKKNLEKKDLPLNYKIFIILFFINYNFEYETFDSDNFFICDIRRRRSLYDIYLIVSNYYDVTFEDVIKHVLSMKNLNYQFCNDVQKYVFYENKLSFYKSSGKNPLEFTDEINLNDLKEYFNIQN